MNYRLSRLHFFFHCTRQVKQTKCNNIVKKELGLAVQMEIYKITERTLPAHSTTPEALCYFPLFYSGSKYS